MVINQGSIFYFQFSSSNGHEQEKYRPAIILSNNLVAKYSGMYIVAPISHTRRQFPMYYALEDTQRINGKVLLDQTRALDLASRHITQDNVIETVNSDEMKRINNVYKIMFEID